MRFRFGNLLKFYSKGFTLVELLIYSMIFTVAAGLLTGILIAVSGIQTRENAAFEVTRQLQFVTQKIQYAIRDASVVEGVYEGDTEGTECTEFCSIKLRVEDPTLDPTIISSDIGGVYIREGVRPKAALTTADVRISSLVFTKVGNPGGLSTVTVDLAMIFNPDDPKLRVEKHLASAIAHVSAATFDSDLLPDETETRNIGGTSLKWNNLVLSGGVTVTGPDSIGEQVGLSMARGASHGLSAISQYYVTSTPYDEYGQRYDIGGTPMLYLEGDIGQSSRRAYFTNTNLGIGTTNPDYKLDINSSVDYLTLRLGGSGIPLLKFANQDYNSGNGAELYQKDEGTLLINTNSTTTAISILASGNVGIGVANPGSYKLYVDGTSYFAGNAYFTADVSALSFTDRTPYPENLGVAYNAVLSMKRLPDGEYNPTDKERQLDHFSLTDFVRGTDGNRDLSATVSAQNEVIKDLIKRIKELEAKIK
ncbi:MAG: prepilin-type N-terminal cleavage/methylation domain-containing protein [Parcubacteria group bacterium]